MQYEDATACQRVGREGEAAFSARPGNAWGELPPAGVLLALQHLLLLPQLWQGGGGGGGGETADLLLLPVAHRVSHGLEQVIVGMDHPTSS